MIEILADSKFENAVQDLNLTSAQCLYADANGTHCIWGLSEDDFHNISSIDEIDWHREWGWWRYSTGSNMFIPDVLYNINGKDIWAWDGYFREHICDYCGDLENGDCRSTESDQLLCCGGRDYPDIITYFSDELGASTETNICALAVDLAKYNGCTLAELFGNYLGGNQA